MSSPMRWMTQPGSQTGKTQQEYKQAWDALGKTNQELYGSKPNANQWQGYYTGGSDRQPSAYSAYSLGMAQPQQSPYANSTPYGQNGNLAYAPPDQRPPPFQQSWGNPFGAATSQPNFDWRNSLISNVNSQLGQMQQQSWQQPGVLGAPQFNFNPMAQPPGGLGLPLGNDVYNSPDLIRRLQGESQPGSLGPLPNAQPGFRPPETSQPPSEPTGPAPGSYEEYLQQHNSGGAFSGPAAGTLAKSREMYRGTRPLTEDHWRTVVRNSTPPTQEEREAEARRTQEIRRQQLAGSRALRQRTARRLRGGGRKSASEGNAPKYDPAAWAAIRNFRGTPAQAAAAGIMYVNGSTPIPASQYEWWKSQNKPSARAQAYRDGRVRTLDREGNEISPETLKATDPRYIQYYRGR